MTAPPAYLELLLARLVRDVPDFPNPGVMFKDICPLLADKAGFAAVVDALASCGRGADGAVNVDKVAGIEARGFILAAPVALALGVGFVPIRKAGKLPGATFRQSYALEYGEATLEIESDAFAPDDLVLVIDDVLATGGTLGAAAALIARSGASVSKVAVLIELGFLGGRDLIDGIALHALMAA